MRRTAFLAILTFQATGCGNDELRFARAEEEELEAALAIASGFDVASAAITAALAERDAPEGCPDMATGVTEEVPWLQFDGDYCTSSLGFAYKGSILAENVLPIAESSSGATVDPAIPVRLSFDRWSVEGTVTDNGVSADGTVQMVTEGETTTTTTDLQTEMVGLTLGSMSTSVCTGETCTVTGDLATIVGFGEVPFDVVSSDGVAVATLHGADELVLQIEDGASCADYAIDGKDQGKICLASDWQWAMSMGLMAAFDVAYGGGSGTQPDGHYSGSLLDDDLEVQFTVEGAEVDEFVLEIVSEDDAIREAHPMIDMGVRGGAEGFLALRLGEAETVKGDTSRVSSTEGFAVLVRAELADSDAAVCATIGYGGLKDPDARFDLTGCL